MEERAAAISCGKETESLIQRHPQETQQESETHTGAETRGYNSMACDTRGISNGVEMNFETNVSKCLMSVYCPVSFANKLCENKDTSASTCI